MRRYAPDGRLDRELLLPTANLTSCAFDGRDLDELYVTTATSGMTADQRREQPLAGALFRFRPAIRRRLPARFPR